GYAQITSPLQRGIKLITPKCYCIKFINYHRLVVELFM
ncbi:MAG: hypothetical protein ACI96G_001353, partial [Flavobacterium sp.]